MSRGFGAREGRRSSIGTINKRYGPLNEVAREADIASSIGGISVREKSAAGERPAYESGIDPKAYYESQEAWEEANFSRESIASGLRLLSDSLTLIENLSEAEKKSFELHKPERLMGDNANRLLEDATMPKDKAVEWLGVISREGADIAKQMVSGDRGTRAKVDAILTGVFKKLVDAGYKPNEAMFLTRAASNQAGFQIQSAKYGPPEEKRDKFLFVDANDGQRYLYNKGKLTASTVKPAEPTELGVKPFYS